MAFGKEILVLLHSNLCKLYFYMQPLLTLNMRVSSLKWPDMTENKSEHIISYEVIALIQQAR